MSQGFVTNTTSFIISSDESLNKTPLSSSQSTGSGGSYDYMTTSESIQNTSQYFVSSLESVNNMVNNKQRRLHPSVLPPPPPTYSSPQVQIYGTSNGINVNSTNTPTNVSPASNIANSQPQHNYGHLNLNQCNGNSGGTNSSPIYSTHNSIQATNLDIGPNQDQAQFYQTYSSGNISTSNSTVSNNTANNNSTPLMTNCHLGAADGQQVEATYGHIKQPSTYSPKSSNSVQTFHNHKQVQSNHQRTSVNCSDLPAVNYQMPINVKGMLLNGVSGTEVIRNWLSSIDCEEYLKNFVDNGYDILLITKMTPQDLTAIGCKSPILRKKLLSEIKKLNLDDDIPECRPASLERWLGLLKLSEYHARLCDEGYETIDKVCDLTWEDLEEIGIKKLGHQKRLLIGIERLKRYEKLQEERQGDYAIYDVHPNHRVSLNRTSPDNRHSTLGRSTLRSGFFQTRSGANLDHRGLPIATVVPALKHVSNSMANLDISQVISNTNGTKTNGFSNDRLSTTEHNITLQSSAHKDLEQDGLRLSDLTSTIRRNPPPLPPVRTNSLKIPQESDNNGNPIYGSHYGTVGSNNHGYYAPLNNTGSTSFLRTPKLGTLTPTTNKMLKLGGHIQSIEGQNTTIRSIAPVREAPLPPMSTTAQTLPDKIDEEPPVALYGFSGPIHIVDNSALINQSSIRHQLASADEFPPPPPTQ